MFVVFFKTIVINKKLLNSKHKLTFIFNFNLQMYFAFYFKIILKKLNSIIIYF